MRLTPSRTHLIIGLGLVALIVLIVTVDRAEDWITDIDYPLTTWRMDLDDALVGLGTILIGVAAIWRVWLQQTRTDAKVDKLAHKMNGGMADLARQHLQESEVLETILHLIDRFEDERDDCHEERRDLHERLIDCLEGEHDGDRRTATA